MKKKIGLSLVLAMLGAFVFAENQISDFAVLGLFGSNTELSTDTETEMSEIGIDLSLMYFKVDKNVGMYFNTGYGFINELTVRDTDSGLSASMNSDYIKTGMDLYMVLGMAFRKEINPNFSFAGGLGLQVDQITIILERSAGGNSMQIYTMGLGGEIGVKYLITPKVFFNAAWNVAYTPLDLYSSINNESFTNEGTYFNSRIYIGIGFRTIN